MATQTWEISQPERIDINHANVNWTEAENFTRDRAQNVEQLANTIKREEEDFCQREREFLNTSTNFVADFKAANNNFINQETQNVNKLEQELARLTSQQSTNQREIEAATHNIEEVRRNIQSANERLTNLSTERANIIGNINPTELSKLKPKTADDASHGIFQWIHEVAYGQPRDTYSLKTFATNYKTAKGAEFLTRLREVNPANLSAEQYQTARTLVVSKETFVNDLAKGKQTHSLAHVLDYLNNIAGAEHDATELRTNNARLGELTTELARLNNETTNIPAEIKLLHARIEDARHYISTLSKLESVFANANRVTEDRIRVQEQYLESIRGNAEAAEHLVRSNSPVHRQPTEPREETQPRHVEGQYAEEYSSQQENREEAVKETRFQAEDHFAGEHETHAKKAEVRQAVPATDLKESQFANSKTGSCESCSIF
jgi:chromosome segregation ATPase